MGSNDKERQRARYLHGAEREEEHRLNRRARRAGRRDAPPDARPTPRRGRSVEAWLEDGVSGHDDFERIQRARRPARPAAGTPGTTGPATTAFGGTVVARHRDSCEVGLDRRVAAGDLRSVRVVASPDGPDLVVGDRVEIALDTVDGNWHIGRCLPRTSVLDRIDPGDPHRRLVLAANVDAVVSVQSAERPRPGLTDRLALAARRCGGGLVVCLNKVDVDAPDLAETRRGLAERAAELEAPFVAVSAQTGEGLAELRAALRDRTCVFVGPSGVGKTSLCNALLPGLDAATGAVRAGDRRGRHVTSASRLLWLADGIRLIDTPGVRAFGLGTVTPEELAESFPEIAAAARTCRFRDCRHRDEAEADCAVRSAVAAGTLPAARLAAWHRILDG